MTIKAFAFDMDGTLLLSDGSGPHPETMKALSEAHKAGYKLILATGRPIYQTLEIANNIGCISYIVGNNGASVYDMSLGKNISDTFLSEKLFNFMYNLAQETESFFAMSTTDRVFKQNFFDGTNVPDWVSTSVNDFGESDKSEIIKQAAKSEKITQLTIKNKKELIDEKAKELKDVLGKEASMHIANEVYLDVNPVGVSKLTGLKIVLKKMDINISEVMSFGDSGNDIQMITGSGYGVAMSNATQGAKDVAKEVIGNHNTDTIAKKMREVISQDK